MRSADFRLQSCATEGVTGVTAITRRTFARHSHAHFGIGVLEAGGHRSHSGRGQVEAVAGDAISVNPGEVHDGAPLSDRGRAWRILYFEPGLIRSAAADLFVGGDFEFNSPVLRDRRVAALFRSLYAAETGGAEPMCREELLLALIAAAGSQRGDRSNLPSAVAIPKARIDDDPAAPATLGELASLAGLNRFQLLRGFLGAVGFTPHAYLVQRRLELARELIERGEPLAQAASASGFADQSHMTRAFASRYGLTPGQFARARNRKPADETGSLSSN